VLAWDVGGRPHAWAAWSDLARWAVTQITGRRLDEGRPANRRRRSLPHAQLGPKGCNVDVGGTPEPVGLSPVLEVT
jgi:hypothetical protein